MKLFACLFCLFASASTFAAVPDTIKRDPLYIVDGKPDASGKNIKPTDILNISMLDSADAAPRYGKNLSAGVVIIITKQFAMKQYQQKLAVFCPKYKDYMDEKHTDSNLAYVLNNAILTSNHKGAIDDLYGLKVDDIKSVTFKKDSHFTTDATVVIVTKQDLANDD